MPDADCPGGFCRRNMRCTERRLCHMVFQSSRPSKLIYNMVRIIVGTLILVGSNKIKEDFVKNIIESGVRQNAGKCAPANGLCLEKVFY